MILLKGVALKGILSLSAIFLYGKGSILLSFIYPPQINQKLKILELVRHWKLASRKDIATQKWLPGKVPALKTGYPERNWRPKLATWKSMGIQNWLLGKETTVSRFLFWVSSFGCQYFSGYPVLGANTFPGSQFSVSY